MSQVNNKHNNEQHTQPPKESSSDSEECAEAARPDKGLEPKRKWDQNELKFNRNKEKRNRRKERKRNHEKSTQFKIVGVNAAGLLA